MAFLQRADYQHFFQTSGPLNLLPYGSSESVPVSRMQDPAFRRSILLKNFEAVDRDEPMILPDIERPVGPAPVSLVAGSMGSMVQSPSVAAALWLQ